MPVVISHKSSSQSLLPLLINAPDDSLPCHVGLSGTLLGMETPLIKCRVDEDECGKASQRRLQRSACSIGYSDSGKEKKMETRFQKLESVTGDGQTCSSPGSRDLQ
jgi:hypothetical protein